MIAYMTGFLGFYVGRHASGMILISGWAIALQSRCGLEGETSSKGRFRINRS
jgi:hypothetical protein